MIEHAMEMVIERPVTEVFDFVVDVRNELKWNPDMVELTSPPPLPMQAGTPYSMMIDSPRGPIPMTLYVEEINRPERFMVRSRSNKYVYVAEFDFVPVGEHTRLRYGMQYEGKSMVHMMFTPFIR
jgi:hypothetical protein